MKVKGAERHVVTNDAANRDLRSDQRVHRNGERRGGTMRIRTGVTVGQAVYPAGPYG